MGVPGGGGTHARTTATHTPPSAADMANALDIPLAELVSADLGTSDGQGTGVFVNPAHGFPITGGTYAVLSTGHAADAFLPNNEPNLSTTLTGLNNSQGNDLVQLRLTLAVPVGASEWAVDFKFLSEEYPEYVGSIYNDAFLIETPLSTFVINAAEIDAPNNVALDPEGRQVTINSVGPGGMTAANAAATTYDGATGKLTAVAPIPTGASQITIIFSVTDLGDSIYDTTVFLDNFRFILGTTQSYVPSLENFPNPERGFYHHTETHSTGYTPLDLTTLQGYRQNEEISLILRLFYLDDFTTTSISQSYLDAMEADFDTLRQAGLKAVVRFAYTNQLHFASGTSWPPIPPYGDADKAQILAHLEQLRPLLNKHRDVIAVVQAGFAGIWGEWYYTDHFVADPNVPWNVTPTDYTNRGDLLRAILAALPVDRMVQIRTPLNKQQIYGTGTGAAWALPASDAHNTSDIARTGHHNDCFLASPDDFGTYADIPQDKAFLAEETKYLAMGGETCNPNPPRSECLTALTELAELHWSYLNWDYHPDVRNGWSAGGCLENIKRKLGYRLTLLQGVYDNAVKPGGEFTIALDLRNDGWAAPFNPRMVELLLRSQSSGNIYSVPLPDDPRSWLADGGGEHSINRTICAPSSMPSGSYDLLLNLPDPEAGVYDRSEYAIRLANDGLWEPATGFNDLEHTIVVDPGASSAVCTTPLVLRPRGANAHRVIRFAGRDWVVRSALRAGPGPNEWSNDERSVWVDESGRLHLKMRQIGDTWYSAEVTSVDYTQEGLHRFYITTPDVTPENTPRLLNNLDKRVVAAPFVYADDHLEVDMEFTRWGEDAPGFDAQYAIQPGPYTQTVDPAGPPYNLHRFPLGLTGVDSTHEFDWSSTGAAFKSFAGHTTDPLAQLQEQALTGGNVPTTNDNLRIHFNLWLYHYLFRIRFTDLDPRADLEAGIISAALRTVFQDNDETLGVAAGVIVEDPGEEWLIVDTGKQYRLIKEGPTLGVYKILGNRPSDGRPTEIIVTDIEAPPGNNTKWGTAVSVSLPGVNLTFPKITQPGKTTLTTSDVGPPLANFQIPGNPPVYYDIHTTALFQPSVEVCVEYDPAAFVNQAGLGLYHYDGANWENITLPGYPDPGSGVICGATDSFSTFAVLESANEPPTADAGSDYSAPEGGSIPLAGAGEDPEGGALTYAWDLDNDGSFETSGQNPTFSAVGLDGPGSQIVVLQVCDELAACNTASATVEITNVAPEVNTPSIMPQPSAEGSSVTASVTFSDPGVNDSPFTCTVNYGDGSAALPGAVSGTICTGLAHSYGDDGSYAVIVTVTDKDNASGTSPAAAHQVNNVPPTIVLSGVPVVNEGSLYALTLGAVTDPGLDTVTEYVVHWEDGVSTIYDAADVATPNNVVHYTYIGGGATVTILVDVEDEDGVHPSAGTLNVYVKPSREVKEGLRDGLQALVSSVGKNDAKDIEKAIDALNKSLDDQYWATGSRLTRKGNKVFDEEKSAVKDLEKVDGADVSSFIRGLVEVDRVLAVVQISDAEAANGDPKNLAKAYERMATAQAEVDVGDFAKAIDNYKKAWEYARKAEGKPVEAASIDLREDFDTNYWLFLPLSSN
ncbi:MAG: DUF4832 domain-containing protein [Chloroflexi bacterium]|nr:DUF4832 domain-containing protein [Chloroflexota bacterium]